MSEVTAALPSTAIKKPPVQYTVELRCQRCLTVLDKYPVEEKPWGESPASAAISAGYELEIGGGRTTIVNSSCLCAKCDEEAVDGIPFRHIRKLPSFK